MVVPIFIVEVESPKVTFPDVLNVCPVAAVIVPPLLKVIASGLAEAPTVPANEMEFVFALPVETVSVESPVTEDVDSKVIFPFGLVVEVAERLRSSSTFNEDLKVIFPVLDESAAPPVLEIVTAPL